jgi:hypothetical protein
LDSEEEIEIEEQYYRTNMKIETVEEMNQYVKIIEYWDITILPDFIYDTLLKGNRDMYHAWDGTMFEEEVRKLMSTGEESVIRYAGSVSLNFLKYLERRNHTFCEYAIIGAICENQMDCFLYLMEKKIPHKPFYLCFKAIEWNRIAIVKYLLEHGCPIYKECVHMSMNSDYTSSDGVEYLKLFHEKGYTFNGEVCTVACQHGNIQCLQYAVEKGYYYNRAECLKICIRERTRCQRFYLVSPNPIHIRYMECEVYMRDLDVFQ